MDWFPVKAMRVFSGQFHSKPSNNDPPPIKDSEMGTLDEMTDPAAAAWSSTHHSDPRYLSQPPSMYTPPATAVLPSSHHYDHPNPFQPLPEPENRNMQVYSSNEQPKYPFVLRRPSARPMGSSQSVISPGMLLEPMSRPIRMASGGNWSSTSGQIAPYPSTSYGLAPQTYGSAPLGSSHQQNSPIPSNHLQPAPSSVSLGLATASFNSSHHAPEFQSSLSPSARATPTGSFSTIHSREPTPSEQRVDTSLNLQTPKGTSGDIERSAAAPRTGRKKKQSSKLPEQEHDDTQLKDEFERLKKEIKNKEEIHRQEVLSLQKDLQKMGEGFRQMDEIKDVATRWKKRAEAAEEALNVQRERADEEDSVKASLVSDHNPTSPFDAIPSKSPIPRSPFSHRRRPLLLEGPPTTPNPVPSPFANSRGNVSSPAFGSRQVGQPSSVLHHSRDLSPEIQAGLEGDLELSGGEGEDDMSEGVDVTERPDSKGKNREVDMSEDDDVTERVHFEEKTHASSTSQKYISKPSSVPKPITTRVRPQPGYSRAQMPTPEEYAQLPLEEKLNYLYTQGFQQTKTSFPTSKIHKPSRSGFKEPRKRGPRGEYKNKSLEWVRETINSLLGIKATSELLKHTDIFPEDTPLQQHMKTFDANLHQRPGTNPMKVHWETLQSPWNEAIYEEFKKFGLEEGEMLDQEEEAELYAMFMARLKRMRADLWSKRPVVGEKPEQTDRRVNGREAARKSEARRNARRTELYRSRMETIMDRIPDIGGLDLQEIDDETKVWVDAYKVVNALGVEGQSSDESEPAGPATVYYAKRPEWRSTNAGRRLRKVDEYRNGLSSGGSRKPGTAPRDRRRKHTPTVSSRMPPSGLPKNMYASSWYQSLSPLKITDLNAKQSLQLVTSVENL